LTDSKLPKGWQDWDPCGGDRNRPVECGNCDWKGFEDDIEDGLWGINDLVVRIDPGGIVPVGACPSMLTHENTGTYRCDSHVYHADVEIIYRRKPSILDKIVEAID